MKRKEALKEIESKIEAGVSKQEIFNKLSSKVTYRSDLLQYLACVPEPELKKKYKVLNLFLFGILILIGALKAVMALVITGSISMYLIPLSLLYHLLFFILLFRFGILEAICIGHYFYWVLQACYLGLEISTN